MYFLGWMHKPLKVTIPYLGESEPQTHQRGASRVICLIQASSLFFLNKEQSPGVFYCLTNNKTRRRSPQGNDGCASLPFGVWSFIF